MTQQDLFQFNDSPVEVMEEKEEDSNMDTTTETDKETEPNPRFAVQLREVRENKEDYEWYPTTDAILRKFAECCRLKDCRGSLLDIGAGNGKVLDFAAKLTGVGRDSPMFSDFYAIEKSQTHLSNMDPRYYILGVDFHKVTLLDKNIDVIFCNPPYSEFQQWASKIIREAPLDCLIFLVLPDRWEQSKEIQEALKERNVKPSIKGNFSFEDAEDRTARAKVHLLEIRTPSSRRYSEDDIDPFIRFFNETFTYPERKEETESFRDKVEQSKIVHKGNLIEALAFLYEERMAELQKNYHAICSLDREILDEFEIQKDGLIKSLKMKLETAKKEYWERLFDGLNKINERLTASSRKAILEKMQAHTGIEFNRENAYAVVMWVIRNANSYFDDQLIETYQKMVEYANVENYTSNNRVFKRDRFSYWGKRDYADELTHYRIKVGHRIVLQHCGGIEIRFDTNRGLSERGCDFVGDLLVVANNLGFTPLDQAPSRMGWENDWKDSDARVFRCRYKGKEHVLFRARAFLNGNMHFQFMPEFIHALNIQHGKLKGWINTPEEAEREAGAPADLAEELIDYRFRIEQNQLLLA